MPRVLRTLVGRLAVWQLLLYALLLPLLYYRLDVVVRSNAIRTFTRHAHAYANSLARELELEDVLGSTARTVVFLDGSLEGCGCAYAALAFNGRLLGSSLADTPAWVQQRGNDAQFGDASDPIYAVSGALAHEGAAAALYLGFDKRPVLAQIGAARRQILVALLAYGLASAAVAILLARLVSWPLTQLQAASRRVAHGDAGAQLRTDSTLVEIVELARDLDLMRGELVGTAERLRAEIRQRQLEQAERAQLEEQLHHEQRLATIGTFAGGLAHEFNNILVPLILYTEEALDRISPADPVRASLDRVLAAATRASHLVNRLLAFARPLGERALEPVELAAATRGALELFQALVPPNVELLRDLGAPGERVLGDATLLNQVVLNLCTNAVRAMRESGGVLRVSITARAASPAELASGTAPRLLELRVRDSGHGMSEATRERLFEPFFTTRAVGEGSGLGLAVVHRIVTGMGGRIHTVSAPGEGAEFIVELPALAPGARGG